MSITNIVCYDFANLFLKYVLPSSCPGIMVNEIMPMHLEVHCIYRCSLV